MVIAGFIISVVAFIVAGLTYLDRLSNTKINMARLESEIRRNVEDANNRITQFSLASSSLLAKAAINRSTLTDIENKQLEIYSQIQVALEQGLLNLYESACASYIDGKVDKERFKKNFHIEIRNILLNKALEQYLNPTTSSYKALLKVYKEWNDLENNR